MTSDISALLAPIEARALDCASYNFGMVNANKLAYEDVPRLLKTIDAVRALHKEILPVNEPVAYMTICDACEKLYPCDTIIAVTDVLGGYA
jgi:hypothetical protein